MSDADFNSEKVWVKVKVKDVTAFTRGIVISWRIGRCPCCVIPHFSRETRSHLNVALARKVEVVLVDRLLYGHSATLEARRTREELSLRRRLRAVHVGNDDDNMADRNAAASQTTLVERLTEIGLRTYDNVRRANEHQSSIMNGTAVAD